jgi:L-alanine-DL-glutamate epimerase-like enolase superfamily enzyme
LVIESRQLVEEQGYRGVKIKVGGPDPSEDIRRVEAVRQVIGPRNKLMVDANGRWNITTALQVGRVLDDYDVYWFEEPIWYDDLKGHKRLAESIRTPLALGEQLDRLDDFRNFIEAGEVQFVQADAVRLAGITEWWRVADLAFASHLPVVPHIGDMTQVHLHLCIAHPACDLLEYIPWMKTCFEKPTVVQDGYFETPRLPGAGTTLSSGTLEKYNVL